MNDKWMWRISFSLYVLASGSVIALLVYRAMVIDGWVK